MLIRSFQEAEKNGQVVSISHGKSSAVRVLLKADGLGFSLSEARCGAGNRSKLWYKNHWEANYIRAGRGSIRNLDTHEELALYPGVIYCVGPNDRHSIINSDDPLRIVSIFCPPITGLETHDEDGAFPPTGDVTQGRDAMFVRTIDDIRALDGEKILGGGAVKALRLVTAADDMGFSVSDVTLKAGTDITLWYKNHWEANLILEGHLNLTHQTTNEQHQLEFGDVYCVGPNDPHRITCKTEVKLLAIFNPPLSGDEKHDADGAYPPTGPIPLGPRN
jgi:L-ectoine synthase